MILTAQCLRTLRQPSRAAIVLPISSIRQSRSTAYSNSTIAPGQRRAFSLASVLNTSQDLVLGLHHVTGTPWYITIPIVAAGVAAIFRLPLQIYTQKMVQRRHQYDGLLMAMNAKELMQIAREQNCTTEEAIKLATKRSKKLEKRVYKRAGLQQWKIICGSFLSLPAWLIAIDTVRRLAGGPRGLAGHLAMDEKAAAVNSEGQDLSPWVNNEFSGAATEIDLSPAASTSADGLITYFEPSLMTEGCLWFTDLTAADPTHMLPFILSVTLIANAVPKNESARREMFGLKPKGADDESIALSSPMRRGIARSYLILSAAIGPVTMHLPAAIHLYWLSSAVSGMLVRYFVDKRWPVDIEKLVKPCKSIRESPLVRPTGESQHSSGNTRRMARSMSKAPR